MRRLPALALLLTALAGPAAAQGGSQLALSAAYASDGKTIPHGLTWRVFRLDGQSEPQLMAQSG
ncbi:MAG: hypothetical protein ACRCTI_13470, partial [Beijerinckiaceae bacterium]